MAHGKREKTRTLKQRLAIAAVALLLCCSVGGTLAWLATSTGPVTNTFEPTWVECEVSDTYKDGVKTNITVTNLNNPATPTNVDAYIRVTFAATWEDSTDGKYDAVARDTSAFLATLPTKPEEGLSEHWFVGNDGFYYYKHIVEVGDQTEPVFVEALQIPTDAPYELNLQVLAEAIQADGFASDGKTTPVMIAWRVQPETLS